MGKVYPAFPERGFARWPVGAHPPVKVTIPPLRGGIMVNEGYSGRIIFSHSGHFYRRGGIVYRDQEYAFLRAAADKHYFAALQYTRAWHPYYIQRLIKIFTLPVAAVTGIIGGSQKMLRARMSSPLRLFRPKNTKQMVT